MPRFRKRTRRLVLSASILSAVSIAILDYYYLYDLMPALFDDFILLAFLTALFPSMLVSYLEHRWRIAVDNALPALLREVSMGQLTGKTFPRALSDAAKVDRGPLSRELSKSVAKMSWGLPIDDALEDLGERLGTPLSNQAIKLITVSGKYGGETSAIFERAATYVEAVLADRNERKARMNPYILVFYVTFAIFVGISIALLKWIFPVLMGPEPLLPVILSMETYRDLFFHAAVIEAVFAGLISGKMSEGSMSAGLRHSVVLIAAGYLAFLLLVGT